MGSNRCENTKRLTPIEAYYSKQIPAADRRRRRVAELEANLLGHPLALFPTLENGLSQSCKIAYFQENLNVEINCINARNFHFFQF